MYGCDLLDRIWGGVFFLALFFTSTFVSNAGISISIGLLTVLTIYMHYKNTYRWPALQKRILYSYIIFFLLLFIATIPLLDFPSLHKLWRWFYWSLPLFLFYYAGPVRSFDKLYEKSTLFSMLFLSGYTLYLAAILPWGTRISGTLSNPNLYAVLIELILPYVICMVIIQIKHKNYNKITLWLALFLSVIGIISLLLTQSRGACIGFLAGLFCLFILKMYAMKDFSIKSKLSIKNICIFIVIMTALIGGGAQIDKLSRSYDYERVLLWTSSYHMWEDHKIVGVGLANWKDAYQQKYILPEAKEPDLTMPHNVFMIFLSQTGIIGTLSYLIFVIGTMVFLIKKIINGTENYLYYAMLWAFITITVHGMVDSGITNKFAIRVFFSYAGVTLAMDRVIQRRTYSRTLKEVK